MTVIWVMGLALVALWLMAIIGSLGLFPGPHGNQQTGRP
jgi:hypothetical protein